MESVISYNKFVYEKTIEMLINRGGYSELERLLPIIKKHTSNTTFQSAILTSKNIIRDTFFDIEKSNSKKDTIPSSRILMSFMTVRDSVNSQPPSYTVVFFTELIKTQIPKNQINSFLSVVNAISDNYPISDVIIVSQGSLSCDSNNIIRNTKQSSKIFFQVFRDNEVLINPNESIWAPQIDEIYTGQEIPKILLKEFSSSDIKMKFKLPRISHNDPQLKYFGIKSNSIIFISRRELVPGCPVNKEKSILYVF